MRSSEVITVLIGTIVIIIFVVLVIGFTRGRFESKQEGIPVDVGEYIASKKDLIVVTAPNPLSVISSPLRVRGEARGSWYFEATFPITLVDWDGRIIAESYATSLSDWMTTDFVPFEGTIEFINPSFPGVGENHFSRRGTLLFQKANPSGLAEQSDTLEIPIHFE